MATEQAQDAEKRPAAEVKKKIARKPKPKAKTAAKPRKTRGPNAAKAKSTAPRVRRKQSTPAQRVKILAAADREGLTANQVQKRFGVKPVTYYSWRKAAAKGQLTGRRKAMHPRSSAVLGGVDLASQVRQALRTEIAKMLPEMIRNEVAALIGPRAGKR